MTKQAQVYGACASLQGQQLGTLNVLRVVSINPLRYEVTCTACKTTSSFSHVELRNAARCKNATCGLLRQREELSRQRQSVRVQPDPYSFDPMKLSVSPGKVW
jgi:hypothetical protein